MNELKILVPVKIWHKDNEINVPFFADHFIPGTAWWPTLTFWRVCQACLWAHSVKPWPGIPWWPGGTACTGIRFWPSQDASWSTRQIFAWREHASLGGNRNGSQSWLATATMLERSSGVSTNGNLTWNLQDLNNNLSSHADCSVYVLSFFGSCVKEDCFDFIPIRLWLFF